MVSNNFNGLSLPPLQEFPPPGNIPLKNEIKPLQSLIIEDYFASSPQTQIQMPVITKKSPIRDVLTQELEQILDLQEEKIEKEFGHLLTHKKHLETADALLEIESWAYAISASLDSKLNYGLSFLEKMFPLKLLDQMPTFQKALQIRDVANLGTNFLGAVDSKSQGLALIFKSRILKKSKQLHQQIKTQFEQDLAQSANDSNLTPQDRDSLLAKQKKVQTALKEWEAHLEVEEEELFEEKFHYRVGATSRTLTFLSTFFTNVSPTSIFSKPLKLANSFVFWLTAGLDILGSILSYKQTANEMSDFKQWQASFKNWLEQHQPKVNLTETEKSQKMAILEAGKLLLNKRKSLVDKKVAELRPNFSKLEPKIKELKKPAFHREIQQLIQSLENQPISPVEVQKQLQSLGFFNPAMAGPNQSLLTALERFKTDFQPSEADISTSANPSEAQHQFKEQLKQWMNEDTVVDQQFQQWFQNENPDILLETYVDHQETLEQVTKNALKQMVNQKHDLENRFLNLKLKSSKIYLTLAVLLIALDVTMKALALLTLPMGGLGLLLFILSNGTFFVGLGIFGASVSLISNYRPYSAKLLTLSFRVKMALTRLKSSIQAYSHQAKDKKLIETAKILHNLHTQTNNSSPSNAEYQKALVNYKKAKAKFQQSQVKVEEWAHKTQEYEARVAREGWKDFVQYASLKAPDQTSEFDTLQAFQKALEACDLSLLSEETKQLLEVQLGFSLESLQTQINQDPEEFKNTLQKFFSLDDVNLMKFITLQKARMKKGLIPQST